MAEGDEPGQLGHEAEGLHGLVERVPGGGVALEGEAGDEEREGGHEGHHHAEAGGGHRHEGGAAAEGEVDGQRLEEREALVDGQPPGDGGVGDHEGERPQAEDPGQDRGVGVDGVDHGHRGRAAATQGGPSRRMASPAASGLVRTQRVPATRAMAAGTTSAGLRRQRREGGGQGVAEGHRRRPRARPPARRGCRPGAGSGPPPTGRPG